MLTQGEGDQYSVKAHLARHEGDGALRSVVLRPEAIAHRITHPDQSRRIYTRVVERNHARAVIRYRQHHIG
jgi:hypothetical protein